MPGVVRALLSCMCALDPLEPEQRAPHLGAPGRRAPPFQGSPSCPAEPTPKTQSANSNSPTIGRPACLSLSVSSCFNFHQCLSCSSIPWTKPVFFFSRSRRHWIVAFIFFVLFFLRSPLSPLQSHEIPRPRSRPASVASQRVDTTTPKPSRE